MMIQRTKIQKLINRLIYFTSTFPDDSTKVSTICLPIVPFTTLPVTNKFIRANILNVLREIIDNIWNNLKSIILKKIYLQAY